MSDLQTHLNDIEQRRQFSVRIQQLNNSCEKLTKIRDDLYSRMIELNKVTDQLINDKDEIVTSQSKFGGIYPSAQQQQSISPSPRKTNELNLSNYKKTIYEPMISNNNLLLIDESNQIRQENSCPIYNDASLKLNKNDKKPSETFKIKLAYCLREVEPKIDEIHKIVNQIYDL